TCCRMGCDTIEDAHHIFVHCRRYDEWRASAAVELQKRPLTKLIEKGFEEVECINFLAEAKLLFTDKCSLWPLHYSGHVPNFDLLPTRANLSKLAFTRLAYHFSADWHTTSIRLAGRIWGNWQKETAVTLDVRSR
ncbi:hypothetical protein B0H14DRAFT_3567083, partial [Mycena olivaceomarginata]